ncbi:unnamed protein product, partial [Phaeothamnion confervicola]
VEDSWDPKLYRKFERQRDEPFAELVNMLRAPLHDAKVVDLGCGDGRLSARLHDIISPRSTRAVDSSHAMLSEAPLREGLEFVQGDLREHLASSSWDVVFSHGALQWVDDQRELFLQIIDSLRPGGQIAIQMPANHDLLIHVVAREVARRPEYAEELGGYNRVLPVLDPSDYALLLADSGLEEQKVSLRVFMHRLRDAAEMADWARGTFLTPYRRRLGEESFERFFGDYKEALGAQIPSGQPCWLPIKRVIMWARKPELIA